MKKVLSLLVAFVFLQTQTWALSGGPFQTQTGASTIGTYAGVMIPNAIVAAGVPGVVPRSSSIGLFSFAQPQVGLATGAVLIFINGTGFTGTITGLIDPEDGTLTAIIDSASVYTIPIIVPTTVLVGGIPTTTFTTIDTNAFAQGNMEAEISSNQSFGAAGQNSSVTAIIGLNTARVSGSATVDVFFEINPDGSPDVINTETFTIEGFKQSDTVSATTDIGFGGGGG